MNPEDAAAARAEIERLQHRLDEAESTIHAINSGEVDAFIVRHGASEHVLMLEGVDRPYRLLIERMHQAAITTTLDGTILYANPCTADLLAIPITTLIGTRLGDYADAGERDALEAVIRRARHEDAEHEIRLRRDGDQTVCVHVAASPLLEQAGIICVIITDLTDRDRLVDEHSARTSAELAAGVLREADRRKDEFLAMLAHELRGPLAPIRNGIEVLRIAPLSDNTARDLHEMMGRQVENLVRLVDDLLDVSRVTQGKIRLQRERRDLREVVDRAVESVRPELLSRDHRLNLTVPETPIDVDVDVVRMTQVLINLLNNAIKFTPKGGDITLTVDGDGAGWGTVRVRDSGIGIAADKLPGIFDLFTQVDPSVSRSEGGLGIGLTLARRLAQLHDGSLEGFSEGAGRGAEFVVRIPAAATATSPTTAREADHSANARLRILVVDDNVDAADSMAMLLRLRGHNVKCQLDGESALIAVPAFHPDVVLLDIGLPGMDGFEVAQRLRSEPAGPQPRLIALSGYGSVEDRRRSKEAGFDEHLAKPVDFALLESLLASVVALPAAT
jgi:PAS domain S-box-containing protein